MYRHANRSYKKSIKIDGLEGSYNFSSSITWLEVYC